MSIRNSIVVVLLCLLSACDPGNQRLDKETFQEEQRRREPRRLKEGEVVEAALVQGEALVQQLEKQLLPTTGCCPSLPASLQDSLRQQQTVVGCLPLNQAAPASADPLERDILDAYQYNLEQGLPLEANLQPLGKEGFLYTAPLANDRDRQTACAVWSIRLNRRQVVLNME